MEKLSFLITKITTTITMNQKTLLLLLITFISFTDVFSQLRDSVLVETPIFTVMYSETKEQPLWAEYTVLCPSGGVDRHGLNFWKPDDVHTSDDDDYRGTVWDKGHMAPAAAFNCDREMLRSTFTYVNSALQHQGLNRGNWLDAMMKDEVQVFLKNHNKKILADLIKMGCWFESNLSH